jgi:hypothetical protein
MDTTRDRRVPALDLFSGIGGMSYALRAVARTVAYCERDPVCRDVLLHNMRVGRLDTAPVFEDVVTLGPAQLGARGLRPVLLTAGFPCQDVSVAGNRAGLDGDKSSLFFHIVRILDQTPSLLHALLENSPNLRRLGLERVLHALRRAGLVHIAFVYASASDVGALHRRSRWICVASRDPHRLPRFTGPLRAWVSWDWVAEPVPRVVPRPALDAASRALTRRCRMLGNSVVPQFIAHAYDALTSLLVKPQRYNPQSVSKLVPDPTRGCPPATRPLYLASAARSEPLPVLELYRIVADNRVALRLVDDRGHVLRELDRWHTPVQGVWTQVRRVGTRRALQNTANNIYYEASTVCPAASDVSQRSLHCRVNPQFIEHLMGFPRDWTKVYDG